MKHSATLLLGSNVPDREEKLQAAVGGLEQVADVTARSHIYVSPDRSGLGEPYANIVLKCSTALSLGELRCYISGLERRLGRTPQSKSMGVMPVDIDLVVWDGNVVSEADYDSPQYRQCIERMPHEVK